MVVKKVLSNGLVVLVDTITRIPRVSMQLWYGVGAKDEKDSEHGIAHLIEHMIFKGTTKLSESDINVIVHHMSGSCNAFTSHDYTGYLFDVPSQYCFDVMPIMADCMRNCLFKEDFLCSELKAVIQELKMYNDDYVSTLIERMMGSIFIEHPYGYPVIGYKKDLLNFKRDQLLDFYNRHYIPNNATLVVVGDVDSVELFSKAEEIFGTIPADNSYKKTTYCHVKDMSSSGITLYRDIVQPFAIAAWVMPGINERKEYFYDVLSWVLGAGKGSFLYQELVEEKDLVYDIETFVYDLFEHSVFFVYFQPKNADSIPLIYQEINSIIQNFMHKGVPQDLIKSARTRVNLDIAGLKEHLQKYAYMLGKSYIALGDEQYVGSYDDYTDLEVENELKNIINTCMHVEFMHQGCVLPLSMEGKILWQGIQKSCDEEDSAILNAMVRELPIEGPRYALTMPIKKTPPFLFPKPHKIIFPNGLTILLYQTTLVDKIELLVDFKAKHYHDPIGKDGLSTYLFDMLQEGAGEYDTCDFARMLDEQGIKVSTFPGSVSMSMLSKDFERGLEILMLMFKKARFDDESLKKVKEKLIIDCVEFWDDHTQSITQLMREAVYGSHPYARNVFGNIQSLEKLTQNDIVDAYAQFVIPDQTVISIVGNINLEGIQTILEKYVGCWQGSKSVEDNFPLVKPSSKKISKKYMNRDQVALAFGSLSVSRLDEKYDYLLLYDQIFGGGVLGSMNSLLFDLREQSGLFYGISGSFIAGSYKEPGMVYIKTLVSSDRLDEAREKIYDVVYNGLTKVNEENFAQAKRALASALIDTFATNKSIAGTFIHAHRFDLKPDHFDTRLQKIFTYTQDDMVRVVEGFIHDLEFIEIQVGRVD